MGMEWKMLGITWKDKVFSEIIKKQKLPDALEMLKTSK